MDNKELLKVLREEHPTYTAKARMLKEADEVLHQTADPSDYLPRGDEELEADYARRVSFASFKGELSTIVARLVGAVVQQAPIRRIPDSDADNAEEAFQEQYGALLENADGTSRSLNDFMEERLAESVGVGAAPFLVDRPRVNEMGQVEEMTSMGFQDVPVVRDLDDSDIRLVPLKAHQITNWSVDASGELNWLRYCSKTRKDSTPGHTVNIERWWEFDRTSWRMFEMAENKEETLHLAAEGEHNLGLVPVVMVPYELIAPMDYTTPMLGAVRHEVAYFRADADLQYATWLHAYPTLLDKRADAKTSRIPVGPHTSVKLDPQHGEDMAYVSAPVEPLEQLRRNKDEARESIRRAAGVDLLTGQDAPGASGRSRAISFSVSEERILRKISKVGERAEEKLFELVDRYRDSSEQVLPSNTRVSEVKVSYRRNFVMNETNEVIEQYMVLKYEIPSPTFQKEMQKRIAELTMAHLPGDTRKAIEEEIEGESGLPPIGIPPLRPVDPEAQASQTPFLELRDVQ